MRLFEAILDANHRALAGDRRAGLRPADYPDALPIVALTCIDVRLNPLLPEVLGVHEDDFIWLRNAGNIVSDPLSSTMRSLALACAVKGGKEIAVIGHTDCRVGQLSVNQLLETFRALGINRANLPDNLVEFFGLFASERQNVMNGVDHICRSPLISPKIPVHGLMLDVGNGRLDWLVNGYEAHARTAAPASPLLQKLEQARELVSDLASFNLGEMKFPDVKIGDLVLNPEQWRSEVKVVVEQVKHGLASAVSHNASPPKPAPPPKPPPTIPLPPPLRLPRKPGLPKST